MDYMLCIAYASWSLKEVIDKLGFVKVKNFFSMKYNVQTIRRQTTDREKIFAKDTFDKRLLSTIYYAENP